MTKTAKYQNFEELSSPDQGPKRLTALRKELKAQGLAGFIIPRTDMYQGENVAPADERLAWLTGFTGSAGFCVALMKTAGVFIDGRYRVQVKNQINKVFTPVNWPESSLAVWLSKNLSRGESIGFDPWLHTVSEIEKAQSDLTNLGISLQPIANPIDKIWKDRPGNPSSKACVYDEKYSGQSHIEKRTILAKQLKRNKHSAVVITLPENIAWLLNIRGSDVAHVPIIHCVGILHDDASIDLFVDRGKVVDILPHLGKAVRCRELEYFAEDLKKLSGTVQIDPENLPFAALNILKKAKIDYQYSDDLIALPKARKNAVEISQAKNANLRDSTAMCEFLCWLDYQNIGKLTEIDVAISLERFRLENSELLEISFDTISASGPNAALPHYRVTQSSDRILKQGEVMLVDSGGQYLDGTTDITRTIAIGVQKHYVCAAFTRVLKGLIAVSRLTFPRGITGRDIDAFARAPLWEAGQDFAHGTGHGVGHFLTVHEGPQGISSKSTIPFEAGMIVSNEPGYYLEGEFGIRTENLLVVTSAPDGNFLHFQTLNFVPIDKKMIVNNMLTQEELAWLNDYHQKCHDKLIDRLSPAASRWIKQVTAPL